MQPQRSLGWLALVMGFLAGETLAVAQQPGVPKRTFSRHSLLSASTKAVGTVDTKFIAMTLIEEQIEKAGQYLEGPPVACFGLRKLGDQLTYTYFIVFKGDPRPKRLRIEFDVPSSAGGHQADVKPFIIIGDRKAPEGDRKIQIEYQFKADPKTGAVLQETLKVDGKEYDKAGPRVFLIDLAQPKIVVQAVKVKLPDQVPDGDDDKEYSAKIARALEQLQAKSAEVKSFLQPLPKFGSAGIQSQATSISEAGEGPYGMSEASLLVVDDRPVACFGITKSPKQKEKYSYFILFKSEPGDSSKLVTFRYGGESSNSGGKLLTTTAPIVMVGKVSKWKYQYQFQGKQRPYEVISESLTIDGKEYKTSEGRVFLVDLTLAKPTCRPLKIAPPMIVPALKDDGRTTTVQRAVEELKANSAEVREFLEPKSKN